jgi:hypothetical protein
VDRTILRFVPADTLNLFLAQAGFKLEAQYGDWRRGSITGGSQEIVTIARRPAAGLALPQHLPIEAQCLGLSRLSS